MKITNNLSDKQDYKTVRIKNTNFYGALRVQEGAKDFIKGAYIRGKEEVKFIETVLKEKVEKSKCSDIWVTHNGLSIVKTGTHKDIIDFSEDFLEAKIKDGKLTVKTDVPYWFGHYWKTYCFEGLDEEKSKAYLQQINDSKLVSEKYSVLLDAVEEVKGENVSYNL